MIVSQGLWDYSTNIYALVATRSEALKTIKTSLFGSFIRGYCFILITDTSSFMFLSAPHLISSHPLYQRYLYTFFYAPKPNAFFIYTHSYSFEFDSLFQALMQLWQPSSDSSALHKNSCQLPHPSTQWDPYSLQCPELFNRAMRCTA